MNHSWVGNSNQPAAGPECSGEELYPAGGEEGGEEGTEGKIAHHSSFASLTLSLFLFYGFILAISVKGQKKVFKLYNFPD